MSVEKIRSATSSSPLNWSSASMAARLARSSFVSPESPAGSPMEPETSTSSITLAGFRCSAQRSSTPIITSGAGTSSVVFGCEASTWLAATIGFPIATEGLPGRNPKSSTRFWFSGRWM
jgi:hypothetical protein